jgi:ring-1,2-phenylacetyl-CoA epoxidase subunit PaaD
VTTLPVGASGDVAVTSRVRPHQIVDTATATRVRRIVAAVVDPEIPVLTIDDLGILRNVRVSDAGHVEVTITPTYSGCPAIEAISSDVRAALQNHGYDDVSVRMVLAPAWTTDWMSEEGKAKLRAYGIAPPRPRGGPVSVALGVRCPQCGSPETRELSRFGSTACKSLWVCSACREPFDSFKAF